MKDKLFDNADSFAMSFDEEWENVDCADIRLKIDKVLELLSDHPFLISNPENARKLWKIKRRSLKKPLILSCKNIFQNLRSVVSSLYQISINFSQKTKSKNIIRFSRKKNLLFI